MANSCCAPYCVADALNQGTLHQLPGQLSAAHAFTIAQSRLGAPGRSHRSPDHRTESQGKTEDVLRKRPAIRATTGHARARAAKTRAGGAHHTASR
eukprot:14456606-Alexandrium_andersonii.AAC.1